LNATGASPHGFDKLTTSALILSLSKDAVIALFVFCVVLMLLRPKRFTGVGNDTSVRQYPTNEPFRCFLGPLTLPA